MSRFGVRALKWPFESKDVDAIIKALERYQDTVSASLNVDQVYVMHSSLLLLVLTLSVRRSSILVKNSPSLNFLSPKMQRSILMQTSMMHDVIPKPELQFARR